MSFDRHYSQNWFRYNQLQVERLAGWYAANREYGHGFSTALYFALAPAGENEDAIWPNARIEDAPHIVELLEKIKRVHNGETGFWWSSVHPLGTRRVTYQQENWARKGLGMELDERLNAIKIIEPKFILDLTKDEEEKTLDDPI